MLGEAVPLKAVLLVCGFFCSVAPLVVAMTVTLHYGYVLVGPKQREYHACLVAVRPRSSYQQNIRLSFPLE
jgi:hypothetical protein